MSVSVLFFYLYPHDLVPVIMPGPRQLACQGNVEFDEVALSRRGEAEGCKGSCGPQRLEIGPWTEE